MRRSWRVKNRRRIDLIYQKYRVGLNAAETAELERLQQEINDHVRLIDPRSTEVLDEIDWHVEELRRRMMSQCE